ncbi:MAG: nucleotidyltransferase domain-containing protein [Thermoplasmatales archaeon]|nr:nucleotidyltransferase domain-containing protein [Thermoplasmatales archaeon]
MHKLCRVDIKRSKEILEGIEKYKEKIIKILKPEKIILFGSFARGDFNEGSDIDIVVIAEWKENFLDRIKILMDLNDYSLPVEAIGYTKEEFEKMKEEKNPFILNILEEGKIIYEKTSKI